LIVVDFSLDAEQLALKSEAEEFAVAAVAKYGRFNDSWLCSFSRECSQELAARGWIGMTWPKEFGGGGRSPVDRLIVSEALITAGVPIGATWFADRQMGPGLFTFGTPEQCERYLPEILAGDVTWCIGMSEPNSGSDLASLSTSAVRDGDEWVINGQKIWTSFAHESDYCYLICRTESIPGKPHLGISEIIVPMDTPGIEVRAIRDMVDAIKTKSAIKITLAATRPSGSVKSLAKSRNTAVVNYINSLGVVATYTRSTSVGTTGISSEPKNNRVTISSSWTN
jgi:alkylation response protein AidB-like acyl-CoA dehydrogenase